MLSQKFNPKRYVNRGMTLIEVLVALFILSTGILGAVAMQASAKKGSFDAMQRSLASSLAQDIIERMRGNDANNAAGILEEYEGGGYEYGVGDLSEPTKACDELTSNCSSSELRATDLYEWEQSLMGADVKSSSLNNGGLLGVKGCIEHTNNTVLVAISWEGREDTIDGADNTGENATFGKGCGTATNNRRQILVNAFIN